MKTNAFVVVAVGSLLTAPAFAEQVARDQVTLGRLADSSNRIVLAKVADAPAGKLRLEVEEAVVGAKTPFDASAPADRACCGESHVKAGDRGLFFVSPSGEFHYVAVSSDADASALVAATRTRLVTIGGARGGLQKNLLEQLASSSRRVREDAAFDLAALEDLAADEGVKARVASALAAAVKANEPATVLLGLAARAPSLAAIEPALEAALVAKDEATFDAAAKLVRSVEEGPALVMTQLGEALQGEQAPTAARLLGRVGGEGVVAALSKTLTSERAELRRAAIDGLSRVPNDRGAAVEVLSGVVSKPLAAEDARLALAGLAGLPEGAKLVATAARSNPDGAVRRLAYRLTQDPVQTARLIRLDPSKDPSEKDEVPALAR